MPSAKRQLRLPTACLSRGTRGRSPTQFVCRNRRSRLLCHLLVLRNEGPASYAQHSLRAQARRSTNEASSCPARYRLRWFYSRRLLVRHEVHTASDMQVKRAYNAAARGGL
jgi:hypothetical protein